ncbi:proton-coupled zinc antiporter SLC30A2-like isoform X2 [Oratosquilla oratoria]|uniref:proton-coupled zinc antiporter SLC30A2-like isoform X2 n=1 Tax=Oratosquilla oratoria TaxID=337810 RepID=UPI003F75986E
MSEKRKLKDPKKKYGSVQGPLLGQAVHLDDELGLVDSPDYDSFHRSGGTYESGVSPGRNGGHTSDSGSSIRSFVHSTSTILSGKSAGSSTHGVYHLWINREKTGLGGQLPDEGGDSDSSEELYSRSSMTSSTHCHDLTTTPRYSSRSMRRLIMAALLALVCMVGEGVGAYYSHSLALLSDTGRLFGQLVGFLVSILALRFTRRPPSASMSFGYYRSEVLGSVVSVLLVWVVTGVLVVAAAQRVLEHPDFVVDANLMLILAGVGIVVNVLIWFALRYKEDNSSSHRSTNVNVRAALIHVSAAFLYCLGLLVSGAVIKMKPEYKLADPITTFVFAFVALAITIPILKELSHILMEGAPPGLPYDALYQDLEALPGVRTVHNLHMWALSVNKHALSVHLGIDDNLEASVVLDEAQRMLGLRYDIHQSTIQVERYAKEMETCKKCQPLE